MPKRAASRHRSLEVLVGAQQGVHVAVVGGVVPVVGVGLEDGVQVEIRHPQLMQVGQLELDALQVPAEIIVVQKAAGLVGLPGGLGVLVGLVEPVGKGDVLVFDPFAEAVGEDLVEHPALDAAGGLEIGVVHRQLPALALLPGEDALAHLAPVDAPEVGVQVKVVEVQPRVLDLHVHRKVVEAGGLAVEGHPVKDGHIPGTLLLQDEVGGPHSPAPGGWSGPGGWSARRAGRRRGACNRCRSC